MAVQKKFYGIYVVSKRDFNYPEAIKALAHYKDFHDFSKKIVVKSLPIYKTVEKIVAVVKKKL